MTDGSFLVVEDHAASARAIARVLLRCRPSVIAATVAEGKSLLSTPGAAWVGIVVDLDLPDGTGFDVLAEARRRWPKVPSLILTGHVDGPVINRSYGFRAEFLAKPAPREHLLWFAQRALAKETLRDDRIGLALSEITKGLDLTPREVDMLKLALAEAARPEIAEQLGVTENTLKSEIRRLLKKIDAPNLETFARRVFRLALEI